MQRTLLSFGHGYSAQALAKRLIPQGWHIIATTRSEDKAQSLAASGVEPLLFPSPAIEAAAMAATYVLASAAPSDEGDPILAQYAPLLGTLQLDWVGYLSTTGVYGDHNGGWVDEGTPLTPATKRGQMRVYAEAQWQALGVPLHIFRLAGIYGPGRGPFAKVKTKTARRIIKAGQVFSRIHVDDIAQTLEASIRSPNPGTIYNVCDDDPAPPQDVIAYAAKLLNLPIPAEIDYEMADMTPMARSFYAESKRVRNDRIKSELGVVLKYPNYREGLRALLAEGDGQ